MTSFSTRKNNIAIFKFRCTKIFTNFDSIPTSFAILDDGINLTTCCLDEKINIYNIPQSKYVTTFKADEVI